MDRKSKNRYSIRAAILKAMAHPSRLIMLDALAEREHCVCELTDLVDADISTVSKHLTVLKNAGIVEDDKRGQMVFYRLRTPCLLKFFSCVESVLKKQAKEHAALVA
jgi:DNA-binding transcriptional ArsR family regulator